MDFVDVWIGAFDLSAELVVRMGEMWRGNAWLFSPEFTYKDIDDSRTTEMLRHARYDSFDEIPENEWKGEIIDSRWVDQERQVGLRSRIAAKDFKKGPSREDLFAGTPDGVLLKMFLHKLASNRQLAAVVVDVESAYLQPRLQESERFAVRAPKDVRRPGFLWLMKVPLYGWRKASAVYQDYYADTMTEDGFKRAAIESCAFTNPARQVDALTHGDDTLAIGEPKNLVPYLDFMSSKSVCTNSGICGPQPEHLKAMRILKREVKCVPSDGWEMEPDPRTRRRSSPRRP
jgi:Reverse transcriptase (RNA-dependent DNA polymerase).